MALDGSIEIAWGGDLRLFRLPIAQLLALEEKRDLAVAVIHARLMRAEYAVADVTETLRLGLMGAGVDAREAGRLVETHCGSGQIEAGSVVAFYVLTAALDAPKALVLAGKAQAGTDETEASAFPSPPSTAPQP